MTSGSDEDAAWRHHANERWVVGDHGTQPDMVPTPAKLAPERPDTTIDGARLGGIEYRAVSLRGFSHWTERKPRQDAYLLRVSANQQWLVGCVADGVSQAPYSHAAADIACREITKEIARALDQQPPVNSHDEWKKVAADLPWQRAVDRASAEIVNKVATVFPEAAKHGTPDLKRVRATMSTTAVGFVVAASPTPEGLVPLTVVVAAGDSSALMLSRGKWYPITAVKNADGDVLSNEVRPLPREVAVSARTWYLEPGEALVVISDGIGDPLGQGAGEVGQFLAAHWSRPPDLFAFAAQAAFYRKGFNDDRTAVAVWHPAPGNAGPAAPEQEQESEPAPEPADYEPPAEPAGSPGQPEPGDPIAFAMAEYPDDGGFH